MPYARNRPFEIQPARSLFVDSEIALMLAARRVLAEKLDYRWSLQDRIEAMVERLRRSPVLAVESYPDECWMFDHAVALPAIEVSDYLEGTDHSEFFRTWLTNAKTKLTHPATGLLISSYTTRGLVYLLLFFGQVLMVPTLLIAAGKLALWRWLR
jgi:hypothetical protein